MQSHLGSSALGGYPLGVQHSRAYFWWIDLWRLICGQSVSKAWPSQIGLGLHLSIELYFDVDLSSQLLAFYLIARFWFAQIDPLMTLTF